MTTLWFVSYVMRTQCVFGRNARASIVPPHHTRRASLHTSKIQSPLSFALAIHFHTRARSPRRLHHHRQVWSISYGFPEAWTCSLQDGICDQYGYDPAVYLKRTNTVLTSLAAQGVSGAAVDRGGMWSSISRGPSVCVAVSFWYLFSASRRRGAYAFGVVKNIRGMFRPMQ